MFVWWIFFTLSAVYLIWLIRKYYIDPSYFDRHGGFFNKKTLKERFIDSCFGLSFFACCGFIISLEVFGVMNLRGYSCILAVALWFGLLGLADLHTKRLELKNKAEKAEKAYKDARKAAYDLQLENEKLRSKRND